MFKDFDEFSDWLELSKKFDEKTIQDVFTFSSTFPMADVSDYIKASQKLVEGVSLENVIARYKRHIQSLGERETDNFIEVSTMSDCIDEMIQCSLKGQLKGTTTYIPQIDNCWKWRPSEYTLFTGYNADGKSLFMRYLSLIKGLMEEWKTAAYAPEDYPAVSFFDDIIHTASGYSTDITSGQYIGEKRYKEIYEKIKHLFYFINIRPPKSTLENVLKSFIPLIEYEGVRVCTIDPLIKITRPKEYINNDAPWAAYVSSLCGDFARRFNVCLLLVLHQLTPKLQDNRKYPKPDKYTIKSGGNFSDSADNVIFIHKPNFPGTTTQDMLDTLVNFGSLKIKKHKLVAIPQDTLIRFNRRTNRYVTEDTEDDLFDFDKILGIERFTIKNPTLFNIQNLEV